MTVYTQNKLGLIAKKIGMSVVFVNEKVVPVTLLHVGKNVVVQHKKSDKDGYSAAVVGCSGKKKVGKSLQYLSNFFEEKSFSMLKEFRVSSDTNLPQIGSEIPLDYFSEKSIVKVSGLTIGKGFAGCVKKYGFATLDKSNISRTHRAIGSTGQRNEPGKVFKGKKMPGHMGANNITVKNLQIMEIDREMSVIAVKGAVPGHEGGYVFIKPC